MKASKIAELFVPNGVVCRTRILLQSAENAATDLDAAIKQSPWNQKDLAVKASFSKLKRDFERAHKMYTSAVTNYHRKQNAEAALLFSRKEERPSRERIQDQGKQRTLADEVRVNSCLQLSVVVACLTNVLTLTGEGRFL